MKLEYGRPSDFSARLEKEKRTYEFLDKLGIEYARVDHEVTATMEQCLEVDGTLCAPTCKNLFLTNRQQTAFYLLMMPADKPFKTKDLSVQIGSARLSFGSGEMMEKLLDITPGSLSVLGLMNDLDFEVTLLIDGDIMTADSIGVHPCINTTTLKIGMNDFKEKVIPALRHTPRYVNLPKYEEMEI